MAERPLRVCWPSPPWARQARQATRALAGDLFDLHDALVEASPAFFYTEQARKRQRLPDAPRGARAQGVRLGPFPDGRCRRGVAAVGEAEWGWSHANPVVVGGGAVVGPCAPPTSLAS